MAQHPLPAKVVDQLLERLASDDSFRALFERNPEAAFERLGYPPTQEQLSCCKAGKLADKATIQSTREEMREKMILGSLAHRPNHWDTQR